MREGAVALCTLTTLGVAIALSCAQSTTVHGIFIAPPALNELEGAHFYDHPFPSDIRRDPDGKVHLGGMLNPTLNVIVNQYQATTKGLLDGFSPAAAAYFTFDGDLDATTFPQSPTDSLSPTSSIQLIDVDPKSPEHGSRKLIEWYFRGSAGGVYWVPDTLAISPAHGYPLRPTTRYALVVTRAVRSFNGGLVLPSKDLLEVLELLPTSPHSQAVHDAFAPAVAELASVGIARTDVVQLTVFTTNDPTSELFRVIDAQKTDFPAPTIDPASWKVVRTFPQEIYEGVYGPAPNYQAGALPFRNPGDGGGFSFDDAGHPVLQGTFSMRFSLVVPRESECPMPAAGYPLALYAHGTGGDFESVWREKGGFGTTLPVKLVCVATMGVDQIFHGARPGAPPAGPGYENAVDLLFFNLFNPLAARTNGRQAAVDVVQQARLFSETHATIPALVSVGGREIKFDTNRLLFVGHSQGGVNGPLFLAADDQTRGGVLSGTGAMITVALLEKTQPAPSVAGAVRTLLALNGSEHDDELNLFHPVINLAQTIVDTTDPLHYMPYIISRPRHGIAKSIYQTEGIAIGSACNTAADCPTAGSGEASWTCNAQSLCQQGDSYAPPDGIEIASVALGLPRELPGIRVIPDDAWGHIADLQVPADGLSGNLASGMASGVLGQFAPAAGSDGHFVVFDVPACQQQAAQFLANLATDPKGRIPALPQ